MGRYRYCTLREVPEFMDTAAEWFHRKCGVPKEAYPARMEATDHTGFYERYGWEFLCMVQGDGEPDMTRMYIHQ